MASAARHRARRRHVATGIAALLVVLLWWLMRGGMLAPVDRGLLIALSPSGVARSFALAATWLGDAERRIMLTALAAAALLVIRQPRRALAFTAITLGGAGANSVVKWVVARPRPDLLPHLDPVVGFSFPSGHAANAMILYLALAMLAPTRFRVAFVAAGVVVALAIGVSRVALAVHWPSDVAAGWMFGLAWLLAWRPLLAAPVDRR